MCTNIFSLNGVGISKDYVVVVVVVVVVVLLLLSSSSSSLSSSFIGVLTINRITYYYYPSYHLCAGYLQLYT